MEVPHKQTFFCLDLVMFLAKMTSQALLTTRASSCYNISDDLNRHSVNYNQNKAIMSLFSVGILGRLVDSTAYCY